MAKIKPPELQSYVFPKKSYQVLLWQKPAQTLCPDAAPLQSVPCLAWPLWLGHVSCSHGRGPHFTGTSVSWGI
jgi:hypothetical protein